MIPTTFFLSFTVLIASGSPLSTNEVRALADVSTSVLPQVTICRDRIESDIWESWCDGMCWNMIYDPRMQYCPGAHEDLTGEVLTDCVATKYAMLCYDAAASTTTTSVAPKTTTPTAPVQPYPTAKPTTTSIEDIVQPYPSTTNGQSIDFVKVDQPELLEYAHQVEVCQDRIRSWNGQLDWCRQKCWDIYYTYEVQLCKQAITDGTGQALIDCLTARYPKICYDSLASTTVTVLTHAKSAQPRPTKSTTRPLSTPMETTEMSSPESSHTTEGVQAPPSTSHTVTEAFHTTEGVQAPPSTSHTVTETTGTIPPYTGRTSQPRPTRAPVKHE